MRGFWLKDESGTTKSLNGGGVFLDAPSGLGFTSSTGTAHLGGGVFADVGEQDEQPDEIAGDLVFSAGGMFDDGYTQYRAFIDWLLAAGQLTLLYHPGGVLDAAYRRKAEIMSLSKGELSGGGLRCAVVFRCMEPWQFATPTAQAMTKSGATLTYDATVDGHRPAPFRLEVTGGLEYPEITVTNGGEELGRCKVHAIITSAQTLVLDTRPDCAGVWRVDSTGAETDMMQYVYLEYDPFPMLPLGDGTQIKVTTSAVEIGEGSLTIYHSYRSI